MKLILTGLLIIASSICNANVISYNPSTGSYVVDQYGNKYCNEKEPDRWRNMPYPTQPTKNKFEGAKGCETPKEPKGRNGTMPVGVKYLDF